MATLLNLPDELLLKITKHLHCGAILETHTSLGHLALTCRHLNPIAQEVLTNNIDIGEPLDACRKDYVSSVGLLVRTLLERRSYGKHMRTLTMQLLNKASLHIKDCRAHVEGKQHCRCDWDKIMELGLKFLHEGKCGGRPLANVTWLRAIADGKETALAGILLMCIPSLRSMNIESCGYEDHWGYARPVYLQLSDLLARLENNKASNRRRYQASPR